MSTQPECLQQTFAQALDDPLHEPSLLALVKPFSQLPDTAAASPGANAAHGPRLPVAAGPDEILRQRIGLYRGNVRSHWRATLANAYPVLLALGGDAWFNALSLAYARAHPSLSGDLNRFGDALPMFIGEYERDPRFRYFVDVARLEWSLHVAYFAADVTPFTPQHWLELGNERLLDTSLAVHPACAAIASHFAIADIWLAHQMGGVFPLRIDIPSWTLVVRPAWQPTVLVQSEAAHAAFMALRSGEPLNAALEAALAVDPEFDFVSQWQAWISTCAITGVAITA